MIITIETSLQLHSNMRSYVPGMQVIKFSVFLTNADDVPFAFPLSAYLLKDLMLHS